jgi:hypothetical protein
VLFRSPDFKNNNDNKTYKPGSWKNKLLGDKTINTRLKEVFNSDRSSNNLAEESDKTKSGEVNKLLEAKIEESMRSNKYNDIENEELENIPEEKKKDINIPNFSKDRENKDNNDGDNR